MTEMTGNRFRGAVVCMALVLTLILSAISNAGVQDFSKALVRRAFEGAHASDTGWHRRRVAPAIRDGDYQLFR